MSDIAVLDASAVLCYLQGERGEDRVEAAFEAHPCAMTTVNVCEVIGKLVERGMPENEVGAVVEDLGLTQVDFDEELARLAGFMKPLTRSIGASIGDRACLALARRQALRGGRPTVYTAESAWARLDWPFELVLIR